MRTTIDFDGFLPSIQPSVGPITRITRVESGLSWSYQNACWQFILEGSTPRIERDRETVAQLTYSWTRPTWICADRRLMLERARVKYENCTGLRVYEEASGRAIAYFLTSHGAPTILSTSKEHGLAIALAVSSGLYVN